MKLTWFGHSCFELEKEGLRLYFDPIGKREQMDCILDLDNARTASAIFVSHEHGVHFDPIALAALSDANTKIYAPGQVIENLRETKNRLPYLKDRIPEYELQAFAAATSSLQTSNNVIMVSPQDVIALENLQVKCLEASEGLCFTIRDGRKMLFMGDSVPTNEMMLEKPDIVLFPVWAVKGEEAKKDEFIRLAKNALCIPMHYHHSERGFPNFYIERGELANILPRDINLRIMERGIPCTF